jgi:hypothetical protein
MLYGIPANQKPSLRLLELLHPFRIAASALVELLLQEHAKLLTVTGKSALLPRPNPKVCRLAQSLWTFRAHCRPIMD